jgi:3-oxoacyl-[acyl-carrier-protein] synthase-1
LNKAVIISQQEVISPLGTLEETTKAIINGRSAIKNGPCFDIPVPSAPFEDVRFRSLDYSASFLRSRVDLSNLESPTVFIYCAAKGDICSFEKITTNEKPENSDALLDTQAKQIASILGIYPARISAISTACVSGASAVEYAKELLERGQFSSAVIFGFDNISSFVTNGFYSLGALSNSGARPFDKTRDGLLIGEATGIAVLEYRTPKDGDCYISGCGSSNDANHRTGPSRTGDGLYRAAFDALSESRLNPLNIQAIKCHGTGTLYNDAMEAKAIYKLFSDSKIPPCYSLKGAIGHPSGAGSLVEILIASQLMKCNTVPPTVGYNEHGVDEPIPVLRSAKRVNSGAVLCLSAGFGGFNAAVVLREYAK